MHSAISSLRTSASIGANHRTHELSGWHLFTPFKAAPFNPTFPDVDAFRDALLLNIHNAHATPKLGLQKVATATRRAEAVAGRDLSHAIRKHR
jgi:hypothetical protein